MTGALSMSRRRAVCILPVALAWLGGARSAVADATATTVPGKGFEIDFRGFYETSASKLPLASAHLSLATSADSYTMALEVRNMLANLFYESRGGLDARGLHPVTYSERRVPALGRTRERSVHFVRASDGMVRRLAPDTLAVPDDTQDRISLVGQLWQLARSGKGALHEQGRLALTLASTRNAHGIVLQVDPPAALTIAGQQRLAWRIQRADQPEREPDEIDIEVWLAAEGAHLPLAIRFSEPGRALYFEAVVPG